MSNLNRRINRRNLLRAAMIGAAAILGGCTDSSPQEERMRKSRLRKAEASRQERVDMLKKVREGFEGNPVKGKEAPPRRGRRSKSAKQKPP